MIIFIKIKFIINVMLKNSKKILFRIFILWFLYGFYRGYNSKLYYQVYNYELLRYNIKKGNIKLTFLQKLSNGFTNSIYYILPPFGIIHFLNFASRLVNKLDNNNVLSLENYAEFNTCSLYYNLPVYFEFSYNSYYTYYNNLCKTSARKRIYSI